ncbi:MAG: hypothetical protein JWO52_7833 [Gammaproteobacteria bacterium]|nr:hypothetical protein [Gammaproteobacteria bacterium]
MVEIAQVSFSKGEVSPIASARTDAAFYSNALQLCVNFFIRAEGAASNRPGLEFIAQCVSAQGGSFLLPFIYNNQQAYLVETSSSPISLSPGSVNIYLNGSLVQSIGAPYQPTDLASIRWAQSADTLNLTVATTPLNQLKRLTPTTFSLTAPTILNGPFQDLNKDGTTYVYASATQGIVTLTASSAIFTPKHVGALFTIEEQFLNAIDQWAPQMSLTVSGATAVGLYRRSDGKIYQCVQTPGAPGTTYSGTFQPVHISGTQTDGTGKQFPGDVNSSIGVSWQFVSQPAGVALITAYIDSTHVTAVVQSDKGIYSNFSPTVVGPPVTVHGPFTFSGNGSTVTFSGLTAISTGDPNQFLVTVNNTFSDPTTYSINQSGTSITFHTAPPTGTNNVVVTQVTGQGAGNALIAGIPVSTYWAFGSFSQVQGYGATVVYYNDRLVIGGTQLQPQTLFTSKTANYLDFGTSTPQVADDDITVTLNARQQNPIVDLIAQADLLIGTSSAVTRLTHSASSGSITPSDVAALPQNFYGQQSVPSVQTGDTTIFVQWGGRKIRDLIYAFQTDKYQGSELTFWARQMFPYGTTCTRMAFAPEPYGLLFCVRSDGELCVCAYLPEQQITAWSRYQTAGFFEDVCVLPENGTFAVYVIVRRFINGALVRYIERFKSREYVTAFDAFFVDSGLTYDGRNPGGVVTFTPNLTAIPIASVTAIQIGPIVDVFVTTTIPHNLVNGQSFNITNVVGTGTFAVNGNGMVVQVDSPTQFQISGGPGTLTGSYVSGGAVISIQSVAGYSGIITCTLGVFQPSDVTNNNAVWVNDANGNRLCRLQIVGYGSATSANVRALDLVPAGVAGVPSPWTFAKTNFTALSNLAGQVITVYADGSVMPSTTVGLDGSFTLQNAGGVVHAGLGYISQLQSMSPNIQGKDSIRDNTKTVTNLSVIVDQSAPFKAGPNFANLVEFAFRQFEDYGAPIALKTGAVQQKLPTNLDDELTICLQHDTPTPLTVLAWMADLEVGGEG